MRVVSGDVLGLVKSFVPPCSVPPPPLPSSDHPARSNAVTSMCWTDPEGSYATAHRSGYVAFHSGSGAGAGGVVDLYGSGSDFREADALLGVEAVTGGEVRGITALGDLVSLSSSGSVKVLNVEPCAKTPPLGNIAIPDSRPVTSCCFLRSASLAVLGGRDRPPIIVDVPSGGKQVWKAKNAPHDLQTLLQKVMYQTSMAGEEEEEEE